MEESERYAGDVGSADAIAAAAAKAKLLHAGRWLATRHAGGAGREEVRRLRAATLRAARRLLTESRDLTELTAVRDSGARAVMLYLPDMPVSADDLAVQVECLAAPGGPLAVVAPENREAAVIDMLLDDATDPLLLRRGPFSVRERNAVVRAITRQVVSARLGTAARVAFARPQEDAVRTAMRNAGLEASPVTLLRSGLELPIGSYTAREIRVAASAGVSKADCVARPHERVIIPTECKYSSSALNGHKRLVKEVGDKAEQWREAFGESAVIPLAVIGGVFTPADVRTTLAKQILVIWDHELHRLERLLAALRSGVLAPDVEFDDLLAFVLA